MIANNEKKSLPSDDYRRCWTTEEKFVVDVRLESWGRTHSEVQAKSSQEQAPSLIARGRTTGRSSEGGLGCLLAHSIYRNKRKCDPTTDN
jgi:hypothetical protein